MPSATTRLRAALIAGDAAAAQDALDDGADVHVADALGMAPLFIAAGWGLVAVVRRLLAAGADPNARTRTGWSQQWFRGSEQCEAIGGDLPLTVAIRNQRECVVERLLAAGARVHRESWWSLTNDELPCKSPLLLAFQSNQSRLARKLVDAILSSTGTDRPAQLSAALVLAVQKGYHDLVELLVARGADVNATTRISPHSAFMEAVTHGRVDMVASMLRVANVNVNQVELEDWTPLKCAANRGHAAIVRLLLQYGADVTKRTRGFPPRTAFFAAARARQTEIVETLLDEHGVEVDEVDLYGNTALLYLVNSAPVELIKRSVRAGADLQRVNRKGQSALMLAVRGGNLAVVEWLCSVVPLDLTDRDGRTALHYAVHSNSAVIVDALLRAGSQSLEWVDAENETPLRLAARAGLTTIVDLLIAWGADIDSAMEDGTTALLLACKNHSMETVQALVDAGAEVDRVGPQGETALFSAAAENAEDILDLLCSRGADIRRTDVNGNTVLMWAVVYFRVEIVQRLLALPVDVDAVNFHGSTATSMMANRTGSIAISIANLLARVHARDV